MMHLNEFKNSISLHREMEQTLLYVYIYVWIFENGLEKFNSRSKRAFFSRQKLSPKSTI